jgi:hypothetical protein
MTIEEVMAMILQRGHGFRTEWATEDKLRAAILALLDAEAEACAGIVTGWREADWPDGFSRMTAAHLADDRAQRIRARIDARKGGAKP